MKLFVSVPLETSVGCLVNKGPNLSYHTCSHRLLVCLGLNILFLLRRMSMVNHERVDFSYITLLLSCANTFSPAGRTCRLFPPCMIVVRDVVVGVPLYLEKMYFDG